MWYSIHIKDLSEKSAKLVKEGIEKEFPLLEGKVIIHKEPEIRPLNEFIEEEIAEVRLKFRKKEGD